MTRWWKCDLQVATPGAPEFRGPEGGWVIDTPEGRVVAADRYMQAVKDAGVEVIVLADHNSVDWVDVMKDAGARHGVTVFPGFEVTTATGSDGAHAILFGGPDKSADDLQQLFYATCGFNEDHPRFDPLRPTHPAPSPKTLPQILDDLPDGYLAIAPHVFGENGLVRDGTVASTLRWKALHHDRLAAIDVGDTRAHESADTFRGKFVRRELSTFPCLESLGFVSTSDAYSLSAVGSRYTWIRMASPTLEAMRQAFLDFDARIVCDWDPRYRDTPRTPNTVVHGWVESLSIAGLTTADQPLNIAFDPRLTVIIGGRGAGKSTVVAALRCLYGDASALPPQARSEATQMIQAVLSRSAVTATHHLAHSGEAQTATWTMSEGSQTLRGDGRRTPTDARVLVINQKELFERAATSIDDPFATSRNLLALTDDALSENVTGLAGPTTDFDVRMDEARTAWISAARRHHAEREATSLRDSVAERVRQIRGQVEAFDSESTRSRRMRNDALAMAGDSVDALQQRVADAVDAVKDVADRELEQSALLDERVTEIGGTPAEIASDLVQIGGEFRVAVDQAAGLANDRIAVVLQRRASSEWQKSVDDAVQDAQQYLDELAALGVDPSAYASVRQQLREQIENLTNLDERIAGLPAIALAEAEAWASYERFFILRRERRRALLDEIAARSQTLRFDLKATSDLNSWVSRVRDLLNLRADGFIEEVPSVAKWLWADSEHREDRLRRWRGACVSGDFTQVSADAHLRAAWASRLRDLDPLLRSRLGAEIADDTVTVEFLTNPKAMDQEPQWQQLTAGSPGQRSAAMLTFVLNHGDEPLVLDQPEDDLDTEWITQLVVTQLRASRWSRQLIVVTHNANIPVNADAERVIVLENQSQGVSVRSSIVDGAPVAHCGALEDQRVRKDIQQIMEGGVDAFVRRERRYNNELNTYRAAMKAVRSQASSTMPTSE